MRRRVIALVLVPALTSPATAAAAPNCADAAPARPLLTGQGVLESVLADPNGPLYYTDTGKNALMALDAPGEQPRVVADGIAKPGGLAREPDGDILVGQGDGFQEGAAGNVAPQARVLRVDPRTGSKTVVAEGLAMANGLARDRDGTLYASDDVGLGIDRVAPDGTVTRNWASVISSNGLALFDGYLYAAQTFQPAAIVRIKLDDPGAGAQTYARPGVEDIAAGPDGMTVDRNGDLYVATQIPGALWRVPRAQTAMSPSAPAICTLAGGLTNASAVTIGDGGPFPETSAYVVTFGGVLAEVPGVAPAAPPGTRVVRPGAPPRLQGYRLRVAPRVLRAGRRARLRVRVQRIIGGRVLPVPRARLTIFGRTVRTNLHGRATVRVRPRTPGRVVLRFRTARAVVLVR